MHDVFHARTSEFSSRVHATGCGKNVPFAQPVDARLTQDNAHLASRGPAGLVARRNAGLHVRSKVVIPEDSYQGVIGEARARWPSVSSVRRTTR